MQAGLFDSDGKRRTLRPAEAKGCDARGASLGTIQAKGPRVAKLRSHIGFGCSYGIYYGWVRLLKSSPHNAPFPYIILPEADYSATVHYGMVAEVREAIRVVPPPPVRSICAFYQTCGIAPKQKKAVQTTQ